MCLTVRGDTGEYLNVDKSNRLLTASFQGLRSSPGSAPDSLRIVGEDTPTDCENLETWYRIQRTIRSPAEAPDSGYDTRETRSEGYRISRTEIIKSPIGLELLADWLRIDKEASNKEKRKALIGELQESYLNERSHVRALAAQQGLPLDDIHAWFMNRVRELEAISFGGELSRKTT